MILRFLRPLRLGALAALAASVGLSAFSGCGDSGSTGTGGQGPETCDGHVPRGVLSFADKTEAWGLVGIAGGRVMSGDVDGDGYPDVFVHSFTPNVREQKGSGTHYLYLLKNEPKDGGGRHFVDRTYESGFAAPADGSTTELKSSQLAVLGDVDNDGDLDVFSGTYSDVPAADPPTPADLDRSEIYLNDGTGKFALVPESGVEFKTPRRTSSATFVDVDNSGTLDLFVGVHYTASGTLQAPALYLGNGDGTFADVTTAWGVNAQKRATFGVASCDVDDDGVRDLMMASYARGPNVLYQMKAESGPPYVDVGVSSTMAYDDDQAYQDNQNFLCWCTVHGTDPACAGAADPLVQCPTPADSAWSMVSETKPERLGGNTFTLLCSDITGDGKMDLYEADIAHWWAGESSDKSNLLVGAHDETGIHFERTDRAASGLEVPHVGVDWNEGGIVAAAADLDGDARQDIILGTSDYPDQFSWIYHQKDDGTFEELGDKIGLHHPCAVGVTVADFDRDGDLDVVVASGTARDCAEIWSTNEIHLYENGASDGDKGWLAIRLHGSGAGASNTAGIGAKVEVEAGGVTQTQQMTGGYGHFGLANDSVLFFPLGDCTRASKITVTWPDGTRSQSKLSEVEGGRLIEIRQGEKDPVEVLPGG
ncbi:MAG TPA: CRTAC1 family protein [Polyangiaceae bacterium]|nr:CRTAC1 family protein [Polyangiaceae bacterium]